MVSYLVHKPDGIIVWLSVGDDPGKVETTYYAESHGFTVELSKDAGSQRFTPKITIEIVPGATFELSAFFDMIMPLNLIAGKLLSILNNNGKIEDCPKDFEYAEMKFR